MCPCIIVLARFLCRSSSSSTVRLSVARVAAVDAALFGISALVSFGVFACGKSTSAFVAVFAAAFACDASIATSKICMLMIVLTAIVCAAKGFFSMYSATDSYCA